MRMIASCVLSSLCFVVSAALPAQSANKLSDAELKQVQAVATQVLEKTRVPSAQVGIVRDGKVVYVGAFGDARIGGDGVNAVPATSEMHYAIGSISKQFTVACVLLLQQQGKLKLDDPVAKWYPELTRAKDVTIRNLLTHTSGYSDYAPQDYTIPAWTKQKDPETLVREWAGKPLDFEPGTKWQYSNTNFVLAGLIVQKVSGVPFMQFLRANVLDPLHLKEVLDLDTDHARVEPVGYMQNALGPLRPAIPEAPGWYFADGELAMPVRSLLEWDISLINRSLLSAASYTEMETEQKLKDGSGSHYGLGISVQMRDGRRSISHNGEVGGFVATNTVLPDQHVAVAVFTNEEASDASGEIANKIIPIVLGGESAEKASPEVATAEAKVSAVLTALQGGSIDQSLLTEDAKFYFSEQAIQDFASSLGPLGKIEEVKQTREALRGGMQMRVFRVRFATRAVNLSTYWMPDGKIEQFLVSPSE